MPWWVDILSAFVRAGMIAFSTTLVQKHVLTDAEAETLTSHVVSLAIAGAPFVAAMLWSIVQKVKQREKETLLMDGIKSAVSANQKLQTGV